MTAAPAKYTVGDLNAVIMLPLVSMMMRSKVELNSTDFDVPNLAGYSADFRTVYVARILPHWQYLGQSIPVKRFLLLRVQIERALAMAFAETGAEPVTEVDQVALDAEPLPNAKRRLAQEQEFLCISLRMTDNDDHRAEHIAEFARCAELYAVGMLHGESGVKSYQEWLAGLTPHADTLPPDLVGYTQLENRVAAEGSHHDESKRKSA